MKYHITHERNGIYHGLLMEAPSQEVAETYFLLTHPNHRICGTYEICSEDLKPGVPVEVVVVPEGRWKGAGMGDYYCSYCDEVTSGTPEYCPHCHAYMG